jgi:predicted metal-dependent enzyme (double-stranded beta helix superfamily)
MVTTLLALLISMLPVQAAQNLPPAFPREGAKQLIDNERVTVWDVTMEKGKPTSLHQHRHDMVRVELAAATIKVTNAAGVASNGAVNMGQAAFGSKGMIESQETTSAMPRHAIMIELKDAVVPPLVNKSGYPEAFPREGAKKVLDNPRVTVWDFAWIPGKPSEMHFHSKDVVVVYLDNGELASTTTDGKTTVNASSFGQAKFNPRDRTHSEVLLKGAQRVIAVELK